MQTGGKSGIPEAHSWCLSLLSGAVESSSHGDGSWGSSAVVMALQEETQLLRLGSLRVLHAPAGCAQGEHWDGSGREKPSRKRSEMSTAALCDALETIETVVRC